MASNMPIAIVGYSCKFAGDASSPEKLWKMCEEGRSAWSPFPASRFNIDAFYHPNGQKLNTLNVKGGHFLEEDVALFDANFFNFTSELASAYDPQFRLQLEGTFEALESAGITLKDCAGSNTSVFAGSFFHDYNEMHIRDPDTLPRSLLVGVGSAMASNRLSHFFDLRGASMTIDTGCSTTVTAFHQACQTLRSGESDMSIVSASNVILNPDNFMVMSSTFLSEAGRSYAFDSRASGYGRGEGTATVLVKRLDDALRDGDPVRAIIRATAVNQDGKTETITTPSESAQAELIRDCYLKAGLDPADTQYFECHGTGTPTGDPIEARAAAANFRHRKTAETPLLIGSVKTNVGHTETASGLASIIKVAMSMERGVIPPSINFEKPNPNIPFDDYHLKVVRQLQDWPDRSGIRRASVNNFGYGGSNGHIIMEGVSSFLSPQKLLTNGASKPYSAESKSRVFMLSAKDETAAQKMISNLKDHLEGLQIDNENSYLDNLAYTLGQRRSRLPWVASQPAQSLPALIKALESNKMAPARATETPKIGYVFTGQGAQWWAMGRELIEAYPLFKASVLESEGYLRELGSTWNLIEELNRSPETTNVNELAYSTPLCAVVQIGIVRLLESWGVRPTAITSHSSGEVAAAYASGALSLRSAMAIVYARGQVAGRTVPGVNDKKGAMAATGLGAEALQKYISRVTSGKVVAACLNSPSSTTASGDMQAVEELEGLLKADNIFVRRLKIDCAYHSHHMQALGIPYLAWLQKLVKPEDRMHKDIIYSSPTTGKRETSGEIISNPQHWVDSFGNPVRFTESVYNMCFSDDEAKTSDVDIILEIGPHAALGGPIQEIIAQPNFKHAKIRYLSSLIRKSNAVDTMHTLASELLRSGYPVNMNSVNFPHGRHEVAVLHDLPSYPWNHQMRHWSEPRINKTHRNRVENDHDLLGSLVLGTNMISPSWRHVIRLSDLPWLRDHCVQTDIVYPGAGYLCMAIEGSRQMAKADGLRPLGYQLREIEVLLALRIPDNADGIEAQLNLQPCSDKDLHAVGWKQFYVYSVDSDSRWTEHCRGLIQVETAPESDSETLSTPPLSAITQLSERGEDAEYRKSMNPADVYDAMHSVEIRHGPIFQNLKGIKIHNNQSIAAFSIADTAATQPYSHQSEHVVDPTTLDSLFQAAYGGYIALPEANMAASFVPRVIKGLYVSADITREAGHKFKAYCNLVSANSKSFDADLVVVDEDGDNTRPVLKVDHYVVQSLGNVLSSRPDEYEKVAVVKWAPDVSKLDQEYFQDKMSYVLGSAETRTITDMRRLALHYINDAVTALTVADVSQLQWEHKRYYVWMKLQRQLATQNKLASDSSTWFSDTAEEKARLYERVRSAGVNGEIVCRMGPAILAILRREILPEELLLKNALSERFRLQSLGRERSNSQIEEIVELFVHQNPRAKMIEIGGGTGTTTQHILNVLQNDASGVGPLAASYDFTDLSSELVEAATDKFKDWESLVRGKTLDIDQDPATQDFENGTYDLVIASQVLTATKNIDRSLSNARKLLKPGGKLILMETTQDRLDLAFAFGLVSDWWTGEEQERAKGPFLSTSAWGKVLKSNGFDGLDLDLHDCEDEQFYSTSVIMATATNTAASNFDSNISIITGSTAPPATWSKAVQESVFKITGATPTIETLETAVYDGKVCIFAGDLEESILKNPTEGQFEAVKALCTRSKGVLWLTRGGAAGGDNIDGSLTQGFLRTLRTEYAGKRAVLLDLDPEDALWSGSGIASLAAVYKKSFDYSLSNAVKDFEYAERDGIIEIPRFYKDAERNKSVFPDPHKQTLAQMEPFHQTGRRLRLAVGTPGLLDTLAFTDDLETSDDLSEDQLEIEPKAFGVNHRDVMNAMGQSEETAMGFECSGIIKRVGSTASNQGFKVGDRITTLMQGDYSNRVRVPWTSAAHISDNMSFEAAASIPKAYAAAYISLYETARLQAGETVLIHTAAGGVGQAAINLAKVAGAEIFVTVGTQEKREFLISKYDIAADHIFSSRDKSFARDIAAATKGKGVDVVLNTLSGTLLQESFNCVAQFGRFVELGKRDLDNNSHLQMGTFARQVSFSAPDLLQLEEHKPALISRVMGEILRLFGENAINTVEPVTVHSLSEIEKTFRLIQANKHMGKIVVSVKAEDLVPVLPTAPTASLREDVSYLIVGGIGGIGKSVCQWLVDHGARNLIIMSRSAGSSKSKPFIDGMAALGCKVHAVSCNISDGPAMADALKDCTANMPPIRGVFQGAMVLQDSIMEQMTVEQWHAAVRPKVQGTWNLHEQLHDLDFFVLLSSLSGVVGLASQCNYAAGNAYQDALARYRINRGLPAVSVDIGVVQSVGVVAENADLAEGLRRSGYKALTEEHVMATLESAITTPPQSQLMIGLDGADWEASGLVRDDRFTALKVRSSVHDNAGSSKAGAGELGSLIAESTSFDQAAEAVVQAVAGKLCDIFMLDEGEVDSAKSPKDYGVDSLSAVELRNVLALRAGAEISIFDIMQSASITALATRVATVSSYLPPSLLPAQ